VVIALDKGQVTALNKRIEGKVTSLQDEETGHSSDKRIKGQVTFQDKRIIHEWTGLSRQGTGHGSG
jgi:hypothetical protein